MRRGAATASAIVHLVLIAVLVFGLPEFARPLPEVEPFSVDIVDVITEVANPAPPQREKTPVPPAPVSKPLPPAEVLKETPIAAAPEPEVAPEPPTPPPPAPAAKPDTPKEVAEVRPPDPVKSEVPEPVPAKEPEKPKAEPAKEPEKPKPKPEPEKPKPEKPKPPKTKPKPEKPKVDFSDLDALLNDHTDKPTGAPTPADARPSDTPNREITNRNNPNVKLSNSERGKIKAQLQKCWAIDMGMAGIDTMTVKWRVNLDRSGALVGQPVLVDRSGTATSAFVDRAYRAFFKCNPLRDLPIDKYDAWKELTITFAPDDVGF
ncbi:hypothetical protein L2U69_14100 [Zavarzinia compransoris]|uniref:hypothetical protein n=1 Tax=Zavarzinia marina TaxID=2911065 RepID=UPI001F2A98C1|nr:hypothetical protein [Zavarzinia marina]MCF4166781.1 hypothetical protein [Zavarzinia marina]